MKSSNWRQFDDIGYGGESRASYACRPDESRGRLFDESESPTRTVFQRDRDRIIHSTAFRRLKHKTQVFINHEGDHYRTRLTHTIEVSQMARSIARALKVDEDLAEALALAHDLGHTPFGHAGEDALDECLTDHGGFDHNAHTLRIVSALERGYALFDGLNLTWEMLEGIVKHNGPLCDDFGNPREKYQKSGIPYVIADYVKKHDLELSSHAGLEAQAAAIADDIAYNAHDVDDGLREGLFKLEDLRQVPLLGTVLEDIDLLYPGLEDFRRTHEVVRRLITRMIEDVIWTATRKVSEANVQTINDVRRAGGTLVEFSTEMKAADRAIKDFLFERMYRTPKMMEIRENAQGILQRLFMCYMNKPEEMSPKWLEGLSAGEDELLARRVGDYVAGMTDRFAVEEHRRLFDVTPSLR